MATALQKQLAAIAANSTHELDVKAQKTAYSKSLLYEPKHAASQTYDDLYQIGLQGLKGLCDRDQRFQGFRNTIFSEQSLSQDRTQLTPAQAEDLDQVVEKFLSLVGPMLLLRPAVKALEWLVRRFRIHEHNTDFMILTFLPYHAAPIFKTLLSIVPSQLSPHLRFLHPYMASLANPPRTVLVQTAVHDRNFFSAFNNYVLDRAELHHQYSGLITLWASIVVQSIEYRLQSSQSGRQSIESQKQQDLLTQVLPILNRSLAITKAPDVTLGSYMIVLVLSGKLDLEDNVLDAFILTISKNWTFETLDAGLGCIAAVVERKHSARLPRRAFQSILRVDGLSKKLEELSKQQSVEQLGFGLLSGAIESFVTGKSVGIDSDHALSSIAQSCQLGLDSMQKLLHLAATEGSELKSSQAKVALNALQQVLEAATLNQDDLLETVNGNENVESDSDATMTNDNAVEAQIDQKQLDLLVAQIPPEVEGSFLGTENEHLLEILTNAFHICLRDNAATTTLLQVPLLADNALARQSLLARMAISALSLPMRRKATRVLAQDLAGSNKLNLLCDYQGLVPYAIVLLSDKDLRIRRSAKQIILSLYAACQSASGASEDAKWGEEHLYGTIEHCISTILVTSFLERAILAAIEDCVVDHRHVSRVLQTFLDDASAHAKTPEKKTKRFKGEERKSLFGWLALHTHYTGSLAAKTSLLSLLNSINKAGGAYRSKFLLPTLQAWSVLDDKAANAAMTDTNVSLDVVDKAVLEIVHGHDAEAMSTLQDVARSTSRNALAQSAFKRIAVIWPSVKLEKQIDIAQYLLDLHLSGEPGERPSLARETVGSISPSAEVFLALIESELTRLAANSDESATKRRRTSEKSDSLVSQQVDKSLARLTTILDILDVSEALADVDLFYKIFGALEVLQSIRTRQGSSVAYPTELALAILSSMAPGVEKITAGQQLDSAIVRTDLLVDCIRASSNAQARNSAMLLLAHLAKKVPQKVLHTVMPIFTLMSSSSATQGDEFTIHVVDQTIREVVPRMADALRSENKDVVSASAEILSSFAGAFEHIPSARRLHLFTLLVNSLGPEDALCATLAALKDHAPDNLELGRFSVRLMDQFSAPVCAITISKYLDLCLDYFSPKKSVYKVFVKSDVASTDPIGGLGRLLSLLAQILKDSSLQARIKTSVASAVVGETIRAQFARSLELIIRLSKLSAEEPRIRMICPKILEGLLSLLPFHEFIKASQPLLSRSSDPDLCRSVVRALELQVRNGSALDTTAKEAALDCIPNLVHILQASTSVPLKQSTMACLDRICDRFGKIRPESTLEAAKTVADPQCMMSDDIVMRTVSLHCLATTVEILGNDFIPLLSRTVDAASDGLHHGVEMVNVNLHNAAYALLIAVIETLPFVVSTTYLTNILRFTQASVQASLGKEADETRQHFLQVASTKLDMQVICGSARSVWDSAIASGYSSMRELVGFVATAIDNRGKSIVQRATRDLFKFFFKALDIRSNVLASASKGQYDERLIREIEAAIINALVSLILKINDTAFRPFFSQLFEWATEGAKNANTRALRSMTFFNLMVPLSDTLKSLVTSYFAIVTEHAAEILGTGKPDAADQALRLSVMRALRSSFAHDQDDFWQSPARFQVILAPLLSQLSASSLQIASVEVVPTITELASCANSQDNLKEINGLLLKDFRSENAKTRLAAVRCQHSLTDGLGEEWLGLLPEMLPFISELQEDDDERVERETHKWIKAIEGQLGESLDAMLQ